jgi:hypothetical protein
MSPLMISIALWYFCRCDDYGKGNGDNNFDAPAVKEVFQEFVTAGLLARSPERSSQEYYGTEALKVYVAALSAVPWPVQQWVIPAADAA